MTRLNVLYLSSEIAPFAKVGGLADVASAFPKAMKEREHDIRVFIPKYKIIRDRKFNLREVIRLRDIQVPFGDETVVVSVKSGFIPDSKVQAYFLDYKPFYNRNSIYVDPDTGSGWADNYLRFALFSRAAFEMLKVLYWQPDIIHCNDWQSSMAPVYLKTIYQGDPFFEKIKTVFTIHNMAYQGIYDASIASEISADTIPFDENHPAYFHGQFNFLKAGLETADLLTTVSPTYAKEIIESEKFSCGLEEVIHRRQDQFVGITNGISSDDWNPETDCNLAQNYNLEDYSAKVENRKALLEELNLEVADDQMLIGFIGRIVSQKGIDLIIESAEELMKLPVSMVLLGEGQPVLYHALDQLSEKYPGRISVNIKFSNRLAHKIEAGADVFLMPSEYEPCGLNQMYSQRYGTVPIVHATGGLADTVNEFNPETGEGTGFLFHEYNVEAMIEKVKLAYELFGDKEKWNKIIENGMAMDFDWLRTVDNYANAYARALEL